LFPKSQNPTSWIRPRGPLRHLIYATHSHSECLGLYTLYGSQPPPSGISDYREKVDPHPHPTPGVDALCSTILFDL
jgi:hypothetical protein